ncbi:MAG: transcription-repair coupling factor, partial [Termitinemataceae bacterium]
MNTLSFPALQTMLRRSKALTEVVQASAAGKFPLEIEGADGSFISIIIEELYRQSRGPVLVVCPTEKEAEDMAADLGASLASFKQQPLIFPWWGTMPYRDMAPLSSVFGERSRILAELCEYQNPGGADAAATARSAPEVALPPLIVTCERALLTPLVPPDYFRSLLYTLRVGDHLNTAELSEMLIRFGFTRVPKVQVHGEFALRGEVLDIYMGGESDAYRILFDFDTIESIRRFDPEDQTGLEKIRQVIVRPLRELVWTEDRIDALLRTLATAEEFTNSPLDFLDSLQTKKSFPGEELFYSLAFDQSATLLDYLGDESRVCYVDRERLENAQESLLREYEGLYRKARRERPVPAPHRILLDFSSIAKKTKHSVSFQTIKGPAKPGAHRLVLPCDPPRSFFGNITYLKEEFSTLIKDGWQLVVTAESDTQALRLEEVLKDLGVSVMVLPLTSGFALPDIKLMLVHENEIFGRRKRIPRSLKHARSAVIDTFVELNPGDFVVHVNYGIGLFKGIERIKALGNERDYIKLEYADEEYVFVPIEQVNLVQRYIGNEGTAPRLDKLGSKSWENRKNKVKKSVEDIAQRLIDLYSKRKTVQGYAFPKDTEWQMAFEAAFPYEETEDQLRCVEEIKRDMESPYPMDRLVCGDVGYGKTEVALRACFKAVMGGKQVAFLAPTTILAEQHYENFQERFSQFPVRLGMLSRFVDKAEMRRTLDAVKKGEIDILVGTHRIIQKDVVFKDLGLIVIDEEQRFGVKDKERLKELKTNVDCLTLSATPIPRTLHMSLLKIRDMSLLTTPPYNRHPIETSIDEFNEDRIAAAIRREVERGGQVFYLHNRVESLGEVRRMLERIVPEMLIEIAHGQMDPQDLEDVMHRFIHGGTHVLVSTTIIENGIDIPNVNTIIIDRADMYGVSQLYQLRGRVGRSDRLAYAYLFYPKDRALSELAMKRLQVISDFTELGSGFKIAMKDMEIRGAGNLLGKEQSGDIYSVGFDLYLRLLDEAI